MMPVAEIVSGLRRYLKIRGKYAKNYRGLIKKHRIQWLKIVEKVKDELTSVDNLITDGDVLRCRSNEVRYILLLLRF